MNYPDEIDFVLKENVKILVDWINNEKGPFSDEYIKVWHERYQQLSRRQ
jgi:protein associated with RNAse G/E